MREREESKCHQGDGSKQLRQEKNGETVGLHLVPGMFSLTGDSTSPQECC